MRFGFPELGLGDTVTLAVPAGWWRGGALAVPTQAIEEHIARSIGADAVRLRSLPGSPQLRWQGLPNPTQFTATFERAGSSTPRPPAMPGLNWAQKILGTGTPDQPGLLPGVFGGGGSSGGGLSFREKAGLGIGAAVILFLLLRR